VRVLLWHGWLLEGSGSNVYAARVAEALRRMGHDVLLLCQDPAPERMAFVDATGRVDANGPAGVRETGTLPADGRCLVLRPDIGSLLPVFVVDEYEGFEVKPFVDLTDTELESYLDRNARALRAAAAWHDPDAVLAGHAVPGAVVARRALGTGRYVAKVHGSDLEYAARAQPRLAALTKEGLEGARRVVGTTRDVLARAAEFAPSVASRSLVVAPGVEVGRFRPRPRAEALMTAAAMLEEDRATARGRPASAGEQVLAAIRDGPVEALTELAGRYDQSAPDRGAPAGLRALASRGLPLAGYLGKLIPQKGVDLFVQAVALLPAGAGGLVIGFGASREHLEGLAAALDLGSPEAAERLGAALPLQVELSSGQVEGARGLRERLWFTGRLDHRYAPFALAALDVLVVPSVLEEAFGMVAAEGAACGALPLLARHSGLAEVAEALEAEVGRTGLFSFGPGPGASERIAAGIERLLALPVPERDELRAAVSAFVGRHWTWDRTAQQLLAAARD
jgi:glycosyltransferase involved in cell wall biosynthesis